MFWQRLIDELPAFLDFLLQWEIPRELISERFGIRHFHHREILQAIDNLAPEYPAAAFDRRRVIPVR